jgi:LL-diaminopimelate aminotransferase
MRAVGSGAQQQTDMQSSKLLQRLSSGIFTELAKEKSALIASGMDVIDLGVGTPNIPPAPAIKQTIAEESMKDGNYVYAIGDLPEMTEAAARWYSRRYGVALDPATEICSVLGSQEGLAHCCLPVIDPGDTVILQDPCYPAFFVGAAVAHAEVYRVPQRPENNFIIDFADIPADVAKRAKLMIVSYPNNPTTAVAPPSFYDELVTFAKANDIFVIHDNAYSELAFDGLHVGSFLSHKGAKDIGAEFNSLSKTYGFAGARLGFCVGNADYIAGLKQVKSNTDYGVFLPVQRAGICALECDDSVVRFTCGEYEKRRDLLIRAFAQAGWSIMSPAATMFVWAKIPAGYTDDVEFSKMLMRKAGVIVVPGSAFGDQGKGYVRIALVQDRERIEEAARRIGDCL